MKERWQALVEKFNGMIFRERLLITLTVLTAIFVFWDFVFHQPTYKKHTNLKARMEAASKNIETLSAEEKVFVNALGSDPNAARKREIIRLEHQLSELDKELEALSVGLIQADKLPQILHDVLYSSGSLKLIGMKTRPVEKLSFAEPVTAEEQIRKSRKDDIEVEVETNEKMVSVYKHAVTISLEGSYFNVMNYLAELEKLPWKIYWEFLDYRVDKYPKAIVMLQVYTLSTEQGVLGV